MKALSILIEEAKAAWAAMSPDEKEAMLAAQRESFARNYKPGPRQASLVQEQQFQNVPYD